MTVSLTAFETLKRADSSKPGPPKVVRVDEKTVVKQLFFKES
jgi:hypothetical protein